MKTRQAAKLSLLLVGLSSPIGAQNQTNLAPQPDASLLATPLAVAAFEKNKVIETATTVGGQIKQGKIVLGLVVTQHCPAGQKIKKQFFDYLAATGLDRDVTIQRAVFTFACCVGDRKEMLTQYKNFSLWLDNKDYDAARKMGLDTGGQLFIIDGKGRKTILPDWDKKSVEVFTSALVSNGFVKTIKPNAVKNFFTSSPKPVLGCGL